MKNILCITYRDWACKIYDMLQDTLTGHNFKIIRNRNSYHDDVIAKFKPDIILWYGWSWIIPKDIVQKYNCICLHPSPLPKYRGGSPIQNQIIRNEKVSAITIFKMTTAIDAGPIIRQLPMSLEGKIEDIYKRMIDLGFSATYDFLKYEYRLTPQDQKDMTYFARRKPNESEITQKELATKTAEYLYNKIRMLTDPYPNAYIKDMYGKKLYITGAYCE